MFSTKYYAMLVDHPVVCSQPETQLDAIVSSHLHSLHCMLLFHYGYIVFKLEKLNNPNESPGWIG